MGSGIRKPSSLPGTSLTTGSSDLLSLLLPCSEVSQIRFSGGLRVTMLNEFGSDDVF